MQLIPHYQPIRTIDGFEGVAVYYTQEDDGMIDLGDHNRIFIEEYERAWQEFISKPGQRPIVIHETDLHSPTE